VTEADLHPMELPSLVPTQMSNANVQ